MESQYRKWVNLSYLALAFLLAYLVFALSLNVVATWDLEARVRNVDLIIRGISLLAGLVLFVGLYRNERASTFMNEVMTEVSRVTWPSTKETSSATFIVIIMVLISGLILGALDYFWALLLKEVLG
jgi:preprotein translocase subunit SecE